MRSVDIVTLAQVVTSVTNLLFVVVLAAGYYFTWRVSQTTLQEMRSQRTAMGRPLVIVEEDYESLPELDVTVRVLGAHRELQRVRRLGSALLQIRARLSAAER